MKYFTLILICFALSNNTLSQLVNGPMLGYSTYREQAIWVQTANEAKVQVAFRPYSSGQKWSKTAAFQTTNQNALVCEEILTDLQPGTIYEYRIFVDHKKIPLQGEQQFTTRPIWAYQKPAPDFSFTIGSCNYINELSTDRAGAPYGGGYNIFQTITSKQPQFMLWLGDNVYYRESDWTSRSGMIHRYTHSRNIPEVAAFLANVPQFAIWDDHDFGPNNSDRSFIHKTISKEVFDLFWANPPQSNSTLSGITNQFDWSDCQFFLLDNRYDRAPNERKDADRTILGKSQLEWLKESLLNSPATFKFIALGGQFLNTAPVFENYSANGFNTERQEIIDFILQHHIKNVVFLTGDRHHSELSILKTPDQPTIYDITISPLTSGVHDASLELNSLRQIDSHIAQRNFGLIAVAGPKAHRQITLTISGSNGEQLYQYQFEAE
jgi:alkaline phosphatase D